MAALETELSGQWHFGDPDLLELVALDNDRAANQGGGPADPGMKAILTALEKGPRRVRDLGLELKIPRFAMTLADMVRQRQVVQPMGRPALP